MHEIGMCEGILAAVQARAAGRRVARIRLRVGALHAVEPDALRQGFSMVSAGTEAEGAQVDLVVVPLEVLCGACGESAESTDPLALCPSCGSAEVDHTGGDELTLESLTYAGTGVAAAAPRD